MKVQNNTSTFLTDSSTDIRHENVEMVELSVLVRLVPGDSV